MKSSNAALFAQLTKLTQGLDFPISCGSNPIHPFIWEVETLGEFNIENLLKTETPNFSEYREGGKIMQIGDLEAFWYFNLTQVKKHNPENLRNFQTLINLLQSHLKNLEALKIRTLYNPEDYFHIIVGQTESREWVGIEANIPADSHDCVSMGIRNSEQIKQSEYQPQTEDTTNLVKRLQQISQDLEFFEPENFMSYPLKGGIVRVGATRASVIHSLLEALGFAKTFPVCKFFYEREYYEELDIEEDDELKAVFQGYLVLDEFLSENLSNLRTYMLGMMVCYFFYIIGQTSSGDWAGVTSYAAWA